MTKTPILPSVVRFGREIGCDLPAAESREWLVTNGIGGYACGTIAGTLTRRYHSLLMAALAGAGNRTLLVTKIDEITEYERQSYSLGANRWADGTIDPSGFVLLESFELRGTTPVWTYACADALLEKRIWMEQLANTTYVQYTLTRARSPLKLSGKVMVNFRGMHNLTRGIQATMNVQLTSGGVSVQTFTGTPICAIRSSTATFEPAHTWYQNYELSAELARGLDHLEDHLHAATWHATLEPGDSVTIVLSTDSDANLDGAAARERHETRERKLLQESIEAQPKLAKSPAWIQQLILAADQFVIARSDTAKSEGASIIAGYPWFGEWGRDTMIALPGLLLATGRVGIAANVIREYAQCVDEGMLPNRIPEAGEAPEYNTVDAALWFVEAVRRHYAATGDLSLIREIFPVLSQIIESYTRGTRYNIHVDPTDGLVYAGESGVQLTWMDAKIGDWVVTPRTGKPVEVNALWINALTVHTSFAEALRSTAVHAGLLETARKGFQRFWNPDSGSCFDVIDGTECNDASVRPNQIFAVSLGEDLLLPEQQRAVVEICRRELLTSFGLRSLGPGDRQYRGRYAGDARYRDSSYHQGTVWGWLVGPFIEALLRTGGSAEEAMSFLAPFENHLQIHGVGTASEIFDGDPPFAPQGCFAQAWTVAEILRAWASIADSTSGFKPKRAGKA